ncbi:alpha-2 adrenergic receptor-like [Argopecten irradians]|uniref:alpha-2 adrenergic receptor-like n=1 Tax=Argopecten irradians TaxID=31199 RepID=UPI00372146D4
MNTTSSVTVSQAANVTSMWNTSFQDNSSYYYDGSWMGDCHTLHCVLVTRYRNSVYQALLTLSSLLSIIGFLGVVGNIVVITVFVRTTSKHSSMYFMLMLAIMDLMVCMLVIPYVIITQWRMTVKYDAVCKIFEMLRYFSIPTSVMILVAISCDRYILICTPPSTRLTKTVTKIVMGVILAIGVMFSVPPILGIGVYATDYSGNQFYIGYCVPNDQYITPHQLDIYWYVVTAAFSLMILIIFTMYTLIFIRLYKQNKKWLIRMPKVHPQGNQGIEEDNSSMFGDRKKSSCVVPIPMPSTKEVVSISTLKHLVPHQPDTIFEGKEVSEQIYEQTASISYSDQRSAITPASLKRSKSELVSREYTDLVEKRHSLDVNKLHQVKEAREKPRPGPSNTLMQRTMHTANYVSRKISNTSLDYRIEKKLNSSSKWNSIRASVLNRKVSMNLVSRLRQTSNITSPKRKSAFSSQKAKRPMHIKTTQVLFIVTLVYVISFLPTFLMSNNVIPNNRVIYYMYFINNASNPIIYSFMNQRFRMEVAKLFCRK